MTSYPAGDAYDGPIAGGNHDPLPDPSGPGQGPEDLLPDFDAADARAAVPASASSPLAALRAEFERAVEPTHRRWNIDARPGFAAEFRVDIADATMKAYRQRCVIPGRRSVGGEPEVDDFKLGLLLLAHYCVGLLYAGEPVIDSSGDPMSYKSKEFLTLAGTPTNAAQAVTRWYGTDGAVVAASRALMLASGWLDDAREANDDEVAGPLA